MSPIQESFHAKPPVLPSYTPRDCSLHLSTRNTTITLRSKPLPPLLLAVDIAPEAQPTDRALPRCLPSYSDMGSVFGRSAAGDSGVVSGAVAGLEDWVQSPLIYGNWPRSDSPRSRMIALLTLLLSSDLSDNFPMRTQTDARGECGPLRKQASNHARERSSVVFLVNAAKTWHLMPFHAPRCPFRVRAALKKIGMDASTGVGFIR
jgi:hypothetical protein